jgi:uncharacterized membrane protein (GlpM family)
MGGLSFSIPYLIFTGGLIGLAVVERTHRDNPSQRQFCRFFCIVLYLLFIGLRGHIGTDWYNYRVIFENIPPLLSDNWRGFWAENGLEAGFMLWVSAVKSLWNNYPFFVFAGTCIDAMILHLFLRRYVDWYTLGFLVFFVMGGLTLCDLMRNVRGIGIFLLSIRYLHDRKALPYFLMNGLGLLFHWTSIFYLPLYWFLHRKWPKIVIISVFIVGNIIFLCRIEYLRPAIEWVAGVLGGRSAYLFSQYLLNEAFDERYGLSAGYIERILTALLILGCWNRLHRQRETNGLFINTYVLYFACFFLFSEIRVLAARASLLFAFSYWVIFPALYETLRDRADRAVYIGILSVYCLLKINGLTAIPLYRYDNLLWGVEHYERRVTEFERYYLNR